MILLIDLSSNVSSIFNRNAVSPAELRQITRASKSRDFREREDLTDAVPSPGGKGRPASPCEVLPRRRDEDEDEHDRHGRPHNAHRVTRPHYDALVCTAKLTSA